MQIMLSSSCEFLKKVAGESIIFLRTLVKPHDILIIRNAFAKCVICVTYQSNRDGVFLLRSSN